MNSIRTLSAAACAAGIAALAPGAADAAVTPGARYDAATSSKSPLRQYLTVSRDAKKLPRYGLAASGRCSNGESFIATATPGRSIAVDAAGAFTTTQRTGNSEELLGRKSYTGRYRNTITGRSTPDGTAITVKLAGTFVAKGLRCSATRTVTLYRDGTPQAPFANGFMTTATYPGLRGRGFSVRKFNALAPGGGVATFDVRATSRCSNGQKVLATSGFRDLTLQRDYTLRTSTGLSSTGKREGDENEAVDHLTLRFFKRGARYGYRGTYSATATVKRRGRKTVRCKVPLTRFENVFTPPAA